MRLNLKAFAAACSLIWGMTMFFVAWWMYLFGEKKKKPALISDVYLGFRATPLGSVIGLAWGLVDGLIGGAAFAWLYNKLCEEIKQKVEIFI